MSANKSRNENAIKSPVLKSVFCGAISSILFFIFIVTFAFIALNSGISPSVYMPAGLIIGAITGFLNGFIAAKLTKEKGVLFGLLSGTVQALICSVVLFFANGNSAGKGMLIVSILIIVLSAVGGITGINLKMKKKY